MQGSVMFYYLKTGEQNGILGALLRSMSVPAFADENVNMPEFHMSMESRLMICITRK